MNIKPCPFCGNEEIVLLGNPLTKIYGDKIANRYCNECQAQAPQDTWNKRVHNEKNSKQLPEKLKFPVALRKMWTGAEVQQWIDSKMAVFLSENESKLK